MYASEVATWRADTSFHRQTTVVESNLLLLSSTILHVYCRNPKWSKTQVVYCLWQLTHLVILVLKPLIPAGYYCKTAASSQVETYSTSNSIRILSFPLLPSTRNTSILNLVLPPLLEKKHSEAMVCFVQRCSLCWCWVCETLKVPTALRAKAFQHVTAFQF